MTTNSYDSRAKIGRHSQHLSDMCLSLKSLFISYVVRTAAVRSKKIGSRSQEKWTCRYPTCDVAIDRTALRIRTTAVRSLANSYVYNGVYKQGFTKGHLVT